MQRIEINYLGPVKNLQMDIKDFNLLIGEQATGKSTVAKGIYFFRTIKSTIADYLCQLCDSLSYNGNDISRGYKVALKKELKSNFISLFGYSWDLDERLYLKYEYADGIWIDVKLFGTKRKYISVEYSQDLDQKIRSLEKEAQKLYFQKPESSFSLLDASKERLRNYDKLKYSVNSIFDDYKETYYIPAGRSMITLLVNNRSLIENDNLDLITRQYMRIIDNIHVSFSDGIRNAHKRYPDGERKFDVGKVADMLIDDLKGDYQYAPGKEYIIVQDAESRNEKIPINFASSGQQEILWVLNQLYVLMLKKEEAFVIIEEPEAHLYPSLQNKVLEFISYFANINKSSVLITTHSPYILTSANALYCAGKTIQEYPDLLKKVYEIVGSKCEISPGTFTALKMNRNSKIQNLIDSEMDEISTEMIDEISDVINEKYINLFYLSSMMDNGEENEGE